MTRRILVHEFVTGGGMLHSACRATPEGSLLREGLAMLRAVVADFAAIPDTEVVALRDYRLESIPVNGARTLLVRSAQEELDQLAAAASNSDSVLVIAPEFQNYLLDRVRIVESTGVTLLGPGSEFVAIASDKSNTAARLAANGVNVPLGIGVGTNERPPIEFDYPAILKPVDGAGSQDLILIPDTHVAEQIAPVKTPMRLERFREGLSCSVASLCNGRECWPMPAFQQILATDGTFTYLGGRLLTEPSLCRRATEQTIAALSALPCPVGFVGVDIVLGSCRRGSEDCVVEVNPRLTTSYVGLRRIASQNLAAAMLQVAQGGSPSLNFASEPFEFSADCSGIS